MYSFFAPAVQTQFLSLRLPSTLSNFEREMVLTARKHLGGSLTRCLRMRRLATVAPQHPNARHGNLPSSQSAITSKLHFFNSVMGEDKQIPTYRVLGKDGKPIDGAEVPEVCYFRFAFYM